MIGFIDDHRAAYGVEPICRVLPIAPSTYHAYAAKRAEPGKRSARARRDAALQADIRRVWEANFQVYGVRKVWRQLRREAIAAPRCQVARLMKRMGKAGQRFRRRSRWKGQTKAGRRGAREDGEDHAQRPLGAMPARPG
jgi:putative transposase